MPTQIGLFCVKHYLLSKVYYFVNDACYRVCLIQLDCCFTKEQDESRDSLLKRFARHGDTYNQPVFHTLHTTGGRKRTYRVRSVA